MRKRPQKYPVRKVLGLQRQLETKASAFELRVAGASYAQIASQLSVSEAMARRYVKEVTDDINGRMLESAEDVRATELARLDRLGLGVWKRAAGGDDEAIRTFTSLMRIRMDLLGLKTENVVHSGTVNDNTVRLEFVNDWRNTEASDE